MLARLRFSPLIQKNRLRIVQFENRIKITIAHVLLKEFADFFWICCRYFLCSSNELVVVLFTPGACHSQKLGAQFPNSIFSRALLSGMVQVVPLAPRAA